MRWTETKEAKLDEDQRAVVESFATRRLVLAGPGSGKTRTLVACVAKDTQPFTGESTTVRPEQVAVVTYTNAAADELRERLIGAECWPVGFCGTLHAMALKALRADPATAGVVVLDEDGEREVVEAVLEDCGWDRVRVDDVLAVPLADALGTTPSPRMTRAVLAAKEARGRMLAEGLMGYDMVLYYYERLLRWQGANLPAPGCPHVALYWDEGQDMAEADWRILEAHTAAWKTLVGDPDQSVFGFRGGRPDLMEAAAELADNPKRAMRSHALPWKVFRLENNYRSVPEVCRAASTLLQTAGSHKEVLAVRYSNPTGAVRVVECEDSAYEMDMVLEFVRVESEARGIGENYRARYDEVAVLCRTNWLAETVKGRLKAAGVPVADVRPPERPPDWAAAKALLAALANPWSDHAYMRWSFHHQGIKMLSERKAAQAEGRSMDDYTGGKMARFANVGPLSLGSMMVSEFRISTASGNAVHKVARELYATHGALELPDLLAHLDRVDREEEVVGEGVTVCTVHAAKGREWRAVCIPGCSEGLFPQAKADTDIGEERRLMFVALTRAKDAVLLTWARFRASSQYSAPDERTRSRFVTEAGL